MLLALRSLWEPADSQAGTAQIVSASATTMAGQVVASGGVVYISSGGKVDARLLSALGVAMRGKNGRAKLRTARAFSRPGKVVGSGGGSASARGAKIHGATANAKAGEIAAKGIFNFSDDELILLLLAA